MGKSSDSHLTSRISHPSRHVLVLVGPTASGKTAIALSLAEQLQAEIISADSRQIYKHLDIGTAKPTKAERKHIKHHFVDELNPDKGFNSGEFGNRGREVVENIFFRKKVPLVVGGSGLYIQSLVDGFFDGPSADKTVRDNIEKRLAHEGTESLLAELQKIDPITASKMFLTKPRRIIRALEVYYLTGIPLSEHHKSKIRISFTPVFVGLQWERKVLYDRINKRVDWMIEQGLVDEVKQLKKLGYSSDLNALQTVGYKEVYDYLDGKTTLERMVELIKQNSRRFAKRQLTWFRRDERIVWFELKNEEDISKTASQIYQYFAEEVGAIPPFGGTTSKCRGDWI